MRLLERLGADVALSSGVPGVGVDIALVLADRGGDDRRDELRAWVRGGGTLVVADPTSALQVVPVVDELVDPRAGDSGCGIDALEGVGEVSVEGLGFDLGLRDRGCLGDGDGFFVVDSPVGDGTVVAVGGAGAFVNDRLGDADNAVLAGALLAPIPGRSVQVLLDPPAGSGTETLVDLVGDGVEQGLAQLGIAFVVYALWRGRRLGRPVEEAQPVELAASELVVAVGELYRQGRHHDRAAAAIRHDVRRRLAERLGLPATTPVEVVVEQASRRTGLDAERLATLLDPARTGGESDLVVLAGQAHAVDEELARAR